jgi:hypothetical protein
MISINDYFFSIANPIPWPGLLDEWNEYKLTEGIDRWTEHGDDVQFRSVTSGRSLHWWTSLEVKYNLPERHRDPQFIRFGPNSTVPIHRDPKSLAWIAVTVVGNQPLEFYNMDKEKLYETTYKFALVNSKQPHFCDVKGKERVLFRKIYTKTSYEALFHLLN